MENNLTGTTREVMMPEGDSLGAGTSIQETGARYWSDAHLTKAGLGGSAGKAGSLHSLCQDFAFGTA